MTIDQTSAVRDVRGVLAQMYVAWAAGDADAFTSVYADDATVVMPGVFHRGRAAVRDYMAGAFAGPLKGSRGIDDPKDIRIIDGDTAILVSEAGILMPGEQQLPADRKRLATWVLSKRDGRWLTAAYTNTPA